MYAYVWYWCIDYWLIGAYYIEPLKRVFVSLGLVTFYMFMPKTSALWLPKKLLHDIISCSYGIIIIQDAWVRQKHLHVVLLAGQRNNLQVGVWQPVLGTFVRSFNWWPQSAQGFPETPEENAVISIVAMPCYAIGFAMWCDRFCDFMVIFPGFPKKNPNLEPRSPQRALNRRKTIASAAPLDEQRIFPAFQKRMIFHESEASGLWWGGAPGTSVAFSRVNIESPWDRTLNTWGVSPIREKRCLLGAG